MKTYILAVAALGLFVPQMAHGQATPATQEQGAEAPARSAYSALYDAMRSGIDQGQVIENQLGVVRSLWEGNPDMQQAEAQFPGLMDAMIDAARPAIAGQNAEIEQEYRPAILDKISGVLDEREARLLADFYSSPLGRKMLSGMSSTLDTRSMIENGVKNGTVDMGDFQKDLNKSAMAAAGAMSAEEKMEIFRIFTSDPAFSKLPQLQSEIMPVRAQMEQAGLSPERQQRMQKVMTEAAQRHVSGK